MNHLITPKEVRQHGRAMSNHVDEKTLEALIAETENMDIRPVLGAVFFQNLVNSDREDFFVKLLLEGGYYPYVFDPTFDATFIERADVILDAHFQGLKAAIAYYVQAKLVKSNDNQMTRFGLMQKESEYGYRATLAERNAIYNDLCSVADQYMRDTIEYLNTYRSRYPMYKEYGRIKNNRTIYRVIGE